MVIKISIEDKRPTVIGAPVIVCGNSDYVIEFTFDDEWSSEPARTARFVYVKAGAIKFQDVEFTGNAVSVPILAAIREVMVGVYAGDLRTTTPARVPCEFSILCPDAEEQIGAVDAAKLQDQIGDLSQLKTVDSGSLVDAINWLYENGPIGGGSSGSGGVAFKTDETLTLKNGILSVNTTNDMEKDNTLPITSAGVFATVGNIEALLKTI